MRYHMHIHKSTNYAIGCPCAHMRPGLSLDTLAWQTLSLWAAWQPVPSLSSTRTCTFSNSGMFRQPAGHEVVSALCLEMLLPIIMPESCISMSLYTCKPMFFSTFSPLLQKSPATKPPTLHALCFSSHMDCRHWYSSWQQMLRILCEYSLAFKPAGELTTTVSMSF